MTLSEYYQRHQHLVGNKQSFLEREFIESVFYPEFGENGLRYLDYQKKIYDTNHRRSYYIDFVVCANGKRFAIELDGYNYHGKLSVKDFEKEEERTNEITRQGYELVRFSYNKIKNKPDEVRRELRQRIHLPEPAETIQIPVSRKSKQEKRSSPFGLIVWAIILLALILSPLLLLGINGGQKRKLNHSDIPTSNNSNSAKPEALDVASLQRNNIKSFVEKYNSLSSRKIINLQSINILDESSRYYRKTNTYVGTHGKDELIAEHGTIDGSEIWIISCSSTIKTSMRVYIESNDHELMKEMVHIAVPYFNPNSNNNDERLERFDTLMNKSATGLFIESINGTYVALRSNNVTKYRLNLNTDCNNIFF